MCVCAAQRIACAELVRSEGAPAVLAPPHFAAHLTLSPLAESRAKSARRTPLLPRSGASSMDTKARTRSKKKKKSRNKSAKSKQAPAPQQQSLHEKSEAQQAVINALLAEKESKLASKREGAVNIGRDKLTTLLQLFCR